MYRERTVGVVIPAYNEAPHVGAVIDTLPAFVDRVYAVDDGSTDGTWDVISERCSRTIRAPVAPGGWDATIDDANGTRPVTDGGQPSVSDTEETGDETRSNAGGPARTGEPGSSTRPDRPGTATDSRHDATDSRHDATDSRHDATDSRHDATGGTATAEAVPDEVAFHDAADEVAFHDAADDVSAGDVADDALEGGAQFRRFVGLRHPSNRGVGAAIKTGYRQAHADGVDVVTVMDGDGQMDPARLDRLLDPIVDGDAEYAKGNRLVVPGDRAGMSGLRLLGNVVLTGLTKIASGYWKMVDPQNGYNAISWHALDTVAYEGLYDGYGFRNDLLVALNAHGIPIADVPMPARYGDEESGIRYHRFVPRLSYLLLRGFLWRLKVRYVVRDFHPLVGLYGLGVLGVVVWLVDALRAAGRRDRTAEGWLASAVLLVASGTAIVLAMVFDMLANEPLHTVVDDDD